MYGQLLASSVIADSLDHNFIVSNMFNLSNRLSGLVLIVDLIICVFFQQFLCISLTNNNLRCDCRTCVHLLRICCNIQTAQISCHMYGLNDLSCVTSRSCEHQLIGSCILNLVNILSGSISIRYSIIYTCFQLCTVILHCKHRCDSRSCPLIFFCADDTYLFVCEWCLWIIFIRIFCENRICKCDTKILTAVGIIGYRLCNMFLSYSRIKTFGTIPGQKICVIKRGVLIIPCGIYQIPLFILHLHIVPHMGTCATGGNSLSADQHTRNPDLITQHFKRLCITFTYNALFFFIPIADECRNRCMRILITGCQRTVIICQFFA